MIRVNKKMEYGILALLYLSDKEDKVASVREIAAQCRIPETLLSKIMQTMKNRSFVSAVYGNQGGYRLTRDLAEINLLDLTHALVGPVNVVECLETGNEECPCRSTCQIVSPMNVLNQKINQLFQSTSIEALANTKKVAV